MSNLDKRVAALETSVRGLEKMLTTIVDKLGPEAPQFAARIAALETNALVAQAGDQIVDDIGDIEIRLASIEDQLLKRGVSLQTASSSIEAGDMVHFYTTESGRQVRGSGTGPYAGLVMAVDGMRLDLTIFASNRPPFPVFAVEHGGGLQVAGEDELTRWWTPRGVTRNPKG